MKCWRKKKDFLLRRVRQCYARRPKVWLVFIQIRCASLFTSFIDRKITYNNTIISLCIILHFLICFVHRSVATHPLKSLTQRQSKMRPFKWKWYVFVEILLWRATIFEVNGFFSSLSSRISHYRFCRWFFFFDRLLFCFLLFFAYVDLVHKNINTELHRLSRSRLMESIFLVCDLMRG